MYPLLTMSLTASIAAGVVMLLRLLLKRVPRWITCLLWAVVLLRMVCPGGVSLPVSLMPETVSSGAYIERVLPQQAPAAEAQATAPTPATTTQTPVTEKTTPVTPAAQQPTGPDRDTVLTILWAAGGIACFAWGAVSYLRLRLRIADAILIEKNIYETDQIDSPFVCGFFRPRIYLPVGLAEPDRRYVLLHEQAHIRRRDYLTKPLAYVALCFHWFNPVLWLAYHLFGRDIETATDQAVIRSFGRTDTAGYAAALLHLGHKPSFPRAVPLAFGEENPKHRIRSVLSYKKPAFWVILAAVAACVILGTLLLADLRPGMTQLGTSQAEPTVAYADGTAYAIQLGEQTLVRSNKGTWTPRTFSPITGLVDAENAPSFSILHNGSQEYLYTDWHGNSTQSLAVFPNGKGVALGVGNVGYLIQLEDQKVVQHKLPLPAEALPFYPVTTTPDGKQIISLNRAPGDAGNALYLYDIDSEQTSLLFPGDPETASFPLGWLDDNTLLISRQSGYAALTLDGQTFPLTFACNDAFVRTVRDGLVVYTYDQDTANAPSPWTADHTLYVARYENGNLTTILEEDDVLPRGRDAAFVSPHGDKLLFLCATLGHQGPGPGVRQECWVYDLTTGKHTAHFPPDGENGETQLIGSACWLDNNTLLLAHRENTLSGENPYPYTISTTKA